MVVSIKKSLILLSTLVVLAVAVIFYQLSYIIVHDDLSRHLGVWMKAPQAFLGNPPAWLNQSWKSYKARFIQADGRVKDFYNNSATTSEGQSYALQQAVWLNDKPLFDTLWHWTRDNLQVQKEHKLFSWKWGEDPKTKKWGVLDASVAADADQDIAFALLMAHERWHDPNYKKEALRILNDIWKHEVTESAWGPVLLPGNWHRFEAKIPDVVLVNPSYLSPALYRVFAQVDRTHPWEKLVSSSYQIWDASFKLSKRGLPPDWVWLDRSKGKVYAKQDDKDFKGMTSQYGYEACRLPWRLYQDVAISRAYKWKNPTGEALLKGLNQSLDQGFPEVTSLDGVKVQDFGSKAREAGFWPLLILNDSPLYETYASHYNWQDSLKSDDYYARNWLWFAVWLQVFQQTQLEHLESTHNTPPQLLPLLTHSLDVD